MGCSLGAKNDTSLQVSTPRNSLGVTCVLFFQGKLESNGASSHVALKQLLLSSGIVILTVIQFARLSVVALKQRLASDKVVVDHTTDSEHGKTSILNLLQPQLIHLLLG